MPENYYSPTTAIRQRFYRIRTEISRNGVSAAIYARSANHRVVERVGAVAVQRQADEEHARASCAVAGYHGSRCGRYGHTTAAAKRQSICI